MGESPVADGAAPLPWQGPEDESPAASPSRARRRFRRLGTLLMLVGVVGIAYGATIYFWRDPVTDVYARWKQHQLASQLEKSFEEFQAGAGTVLPAVEAGSGSGEGSGRATDPAELAAAAKKAVAAAARRFEARLELGQPIGRLVIPELDVEPVVVHGTRWGADLSRGPGHYPETSVPGLGKVTAIAGHRTTFGAWFRNIDDLEAGDPIELELPYGTFHYRVTGHEIVDNGDWSIIEPRGFDELVLSACHPLYGASQRWIVYARLVHVDVGDGVGYDVPAAGTPAASS